MKKTALVIMAAGIGSRFGKGIKQLAQVGPSGEIIMDYSIHDALEAGFNKVVFIIRKDLEEAFRQMIGKRIETITEVAYVFQEKEDLPEGFSCPEDRVKPWGTGQAVLACRKVLKEPFVVINADDYYGKEAFVKVYQYLTEERKKQDTLHICMAGFVLGNTLSDNGAVTRGICSVDEAGKLTGIQETRNVVKTPEGAAVRLENGGLQPLDAGKLVSMNMWGLTPDFMKYLEQGFVKFLKSLPEDERKAEYLLPEVVDDLLQRGILQVDVLKSNDSWFGVTYQEDREIVEASFRRLVDAGVYPENLYG